MKKVFLIIIGTITMSYLAFSQIYMNSAGNVGIGTNNPTHSLHINNSSGSSLMRFQNGNGYSWYIGNYTSSPWSAPNTLAICTETGYPRMEFRQTQTYIHDKLTVGVGYTGDSPALDIDDQKYMMFSATSNTAGILFTKL
jgi:hypothetical protein